MFGGGRSTPVARAVREVGSDGPSPTARRRRAREDDTLPSSSDARKPAGSWAPNGAPNMFAAAGFVSEKSSGFASWALIAVTADMFATPSARYATTANMLPALGRRPAPTTATNMFNGPRCANKARPTGQ